MTLPQDVWTKMLAARALKKDTYSSSGDNSNQDNNQVRSLESTRTDTGVLGYFRELVEIRDLLKTLWTNTARSLVDFVTIIQLSTSARSFADRFRFRAGIFYICLAVTISFA